MIESGLISGIVVLLYLIAANIFVIWIFKRRNPQVKGPAVYISCWHYKYDKMSVPLSLVMFIGLLVVVAIV